MTRRGLARAQQAARRLGIGIIGTVVILAGLVMIVLPGPALVVIPAGLAILGIEYAWARRWLRRLCEGSKRAADAWRRG